MMASPLSAEITTQGPHVSGSLPGPRSAAMLARQAELESNARNYPRWLPIAIARGLGSYVEDLDGNLFIDFLTGAGVLPLGHSHPQVVEAVREQVGRLATALDFPTPAKQDFVDAHLPLLPDELREHGRFQFCGPTGADAVEAALKLCKTATGRSAVIAFQGAFHGSTNSALAVGGFLGNKEVVAGLMPGVHFMPYPYAYRCPFGGPAESCAERCLHYIENALRDPAGGIPTPAAVLIEVVQGEGGVIPAPAEFLVGLRRLTAELGIPLIVDEIQSGYGRTGDWFSFEQSGITPDVILCSKAAGGIGMPVSFIVYHESLDRWAPAAHTGTFRGNQLAFAAGAAALKVMHEADLLANVRSQGEYLLARLAEMAVGIAQVGDIRGRGLMVGMEMIDPTDGAPDGELSRRIQRDCFEHGLILEVGGRRDAVIRMLPPLNVDRLTLDYALDILAGALARQTQADRSASAVVRR